jgi:Zn-dependent protease with chaperone function
VVFPLLALLPDHVDGFFVTLLLLGLVLMGLFACGGGLSLARAVGLARLIDERLRLIVERAAARTGMQPRGCYRIASTLTNAIVFPLSKRLVFTEALTTVLNENELEAVCAHEMAHLQEPLLVDLARLALLPLLLAFSAFRMILAAGGLIALDVLLLGYVLVALLLGRLSWRMEQRADRIATGHESEAGVYARALEKIHAADLMPAVVAGRSSTHPHLYDRLLAAGVQPSYERPRPPSQWRIVSARALAILLLGVGLLFLPVTRDFLFRQSESALLVSLALGGDAKELSLLAYHYQLRGDKGGVATLYRARGELERLSLSRPAILP